MFINEPCLNKRVKNLFLDFLIGVVVGPLLSSLLADRIVEDCPITIPLEFFS